MNRRSGLGYPALLGQAPAVFEKALAAGARTGSQEWRSARGAEEDGSQSRSKRVSSGERENVDGVCCEPAKRDPSSEPWSPNIVYIPQQRNCDVKAMGLLYVLLNGRCCICCFSGSLGP